MTDFEDRISRELHRSADAIEPPQLLWRRVEDRLGRHRDRRAIAVLTVAAVTVVAVAVLAVALHNGRGSEKRVASQAPSTTEPQGVAAAADQTTASGEPSTTVTNPAKPTSAAHTATTATPPCLADDVAFSTVVQQAKYDSSTPVVFHGVARNVSARSCVFIHDRCQIASVFEDVRGTIWDSRGYDLNVTSCSLPPFRDLLAPGQSIDGPAWTWNHQTCVSPPPTTTSTVTPSRPCDGPAAPSGHYNAETNWLYGDYAAYQQYGYPPWAYNAKTDNGRTIYLYNGKRDGASAPFEIVG